MGSISQLILIVSIPILAKLYDPESFGKFNYITSLSLLLSPVLCLGLQKSLLNSNNQKKINNNLVFCLSIIVFFFSIVFITTFVFFRSVEYIILCFLALLTSLNELLKFNFLSQSKLNPILVTKYSSSALSPSLKMLFFFSKFNKMGLLLGQLSEKFFTMLIGLNYVRIEFKNFSLRGLVLFVRRNNKFIKFSLPATILNISSSNLLVYVLPFFYSFEKLGFYFLANKILSIPTSSIGTLVSEYFTSEYIKNSNKQKLFLTTLKNLAGISFLMFLLIFLFSDILISVFFDQNWEYSSLLIKLLIPLHFFKFISSPCSFIFEIENKNELLFRFNLIYFIFTFLLICLMVVVKPSLENFLIIFSLVGGLIYAYLLHLSHKTIKL